jgi:hypothetical protein
MNRKLSRKMRKHLRHQQKGFNWHHRKPRSRGGGRGRNLVSVPRSRHALWHAFASNLLPEELAKEMQEVWLEAGYRVTIEWKNG